ncbi:hypothetical protein AVEN_168719-1 [Araneus ventricosus]|uniref:Uncharacterized protein n=1 Tax=Araneus ventricosus TaxID=182803 RepID=A0A4Y2JSD4_ARAVE|nr:hypothetical protein AVEN_168719-1 [Araneus ventricosus]
MKSRRISKRVLCSLRRYSNGGAELPLTDDDTYLLWKGPDVPGDGLSYSDLSNRTVAAIVSPKLSLIDLQLSPNAKAGGGNSLRVKFSKNTHGSFFLL